MTARRACLAALWMAGAALGCRPREATAPVAAPSATRAEVPPGQAPRAERLVGRWVRVDYDYVIEIRGVAPDGRLDAAYFNPSPIHVSRAEAKSEGGKLVLLVEMTDRNYPGSYYTLTYDPGSDTLFGVYHQLVQNQQFEVAFSRIPEAGVAKE